MSRYRAAESSRSPFRSPPRVDRDSVIEDEIRLKSALRAETDIRRLTDELSILQVKVRHTAELEDKVESLIRQNSQLARENDELAREMSERRYELERIRISASQNHERDAIRSGQLYEANKSLELEIDLLKKQRIEGNRLYEAHIQKLERMLDEKVGELDATTLKCSDLSKQLELTIIRFEEENNRLKNLMSRTEHELERELQVTKQKTINEKFYEIQTLKKNYSAQLSLLESQISKLQQLSNVKSQQFQSQLNENRNLRKRHDEQVRLLAAENDELRARMLKLEQINRSEVENIQVKYSDYHTQGTSSLKEQHGREITLLLEQIDKLKWLVSEKNNEIQNLVQDKRQIRRFLDQTQLELGSEIDSLKNKLYAQQEKHSADSHSQFSRINDLLDKALRDSESYHERVKQFRAKIANLEAEINGKQNNYERLRGQSDAKIRELNKNVNEINYQLEKTKRDLSSSEAERDRVENAFEQHRVRSQKQIQEFTTKLNEIEVRLQETTDKLQRHTDDNSANDQILRAEIQAQRKTIAVLEKQLSNEQANHKRDVQEFTTNSNTKLARLRQAQQNTLKQIEKSSKQQHEALNLRLEKAVREKNTANEELQKYIEMYKALQHYFQNPHSGALFEQKSKDSIFKVLEKVSESTIQIIF